MYNFKKSLVALTGLLALGGVIVLVAVQAGGIATVATASSDTIHACVKISNPNKGTLRIVGANETCGPNEVSLDWNITGPPGANGVSGYEIVFGDTHTVTTGFSPFLDATCPPGKKVLGGGANIVFVSGAVGVITQSAPIDATTWRAVIRKLAPEQTDFDAFAVATCAFVNEP